MEAIEPQSPEARITAEKLNISSGRLLVIDQFLLSQTQFAEAFCREPSAETAADFGAAVLEIAPGEYQVFRSPLDQLMLVTGGEISSEQIEAELPQFKDQPSSAESLVAVDTRCVVFVDAAFASSADKLDQYRTVRASRGEKSARDHLREMHAAVRYGFSRYGEQLSVSRASGSATLVLKPDENTLPG